MVRRVCLFLVSVLFLSCPAGAGQNWASDKGMVMPTVHGPVVDGIRLDIPRILENRRLATLGYVDVSAGPFFADPLGRRDSTDAIQRAVNFSRDHQLVCFFPQGEYLISDTIRCVQPLYERSNGKVLGARLHPCVLVGSRAGKRPVIRLAAGSPGFGDAGNPKYVIHFWARSTRDPHKPEPNISMNQMLVNLDVVIGRENSGAVAIRHRAAQGSGVQECTIDATHGFKGLEGGAGSGGLHAGLTVIGGAIGLDLVQTQPAPTIAGVTLVGQRKRAIVYAGRQALSAVGVDIRMNGPGPAIETRPVSWNPHHGQMSLVDARLVMNHPESTAISAGSSLYLENVFIKGAAIAVQGPGGVAVPGNTMNGRLIARLARGTSPPAWKGLRYTAPVLLDGDVVAGGLVRLSPGESFEGLSDHLWPSDFPGFETAGIINVQHPPYNAVGDGRSDDHAAIQAALDSGAPVFLPKGYYALSRPLELPPGATLVGTAAHLSILMPLADTKAFADAAHAAPLLRTSAGTEQGTIVAFLGLYTPPDTPGATALHWRCGGDSVLRAVTTATSPPRGGHKRPGNPATRAVPLVLVDGNGGGRWFGFHQESWKPHGPGYRHLLIRETQGPLDLYQCNPEHGRGEANMEIRNARNVRIFGLKGEGNRPILLLSGSRGIRVYGYGGNGAAFEGNALFEVRDSTDVILACLVDHPRLAGQGSDDFFAGRGVDPTLWHMVREITEGRKDRMTAPLVRPTAYILGPIDGKRP
ncbi:endopolygalacturonase [Desulfovibrio ferrophilus]|uniref:Endopolygalacturonase n=2 Tax=Desulfovibrio ferrophilus TaxID=241368 RepID=A0A2Z6B174_9BACT|nr:endopolygalacturonase [Desulfovibrio ferrophilus]